MAASEGNLAAVMYLVTHGANVSFRDARNNDALDDAKRGNHAEVVAYLEGVIKNKKA